MLNCTRTKPPPRSCQPELTLGALMISLVAALSIAVDAQADATTAPAGTTLTASRCPKNETLYEGYVSGFQFTSALHEAAFAWDVPRVQCLIQEQGVRLMT